MVLGLLAQGAHATPKTAPVIEPIKIPASVAAAIPDQGIYLAGATDDGSSGPESFYIAWLEPQGLHEVFRADDTIGSPYGNFGIGWVDATHLVTLDGVGAYSVFAVAGTDKAVRTAQTIADAEWHLRPKQHLEDSRASWLVTTKGEAWVERCLDDGGKRGTCKYLRIWGGDRKVVSKRPLHISPAAVSRLETDEEAYLDAVPKPKATRGYTITIERHADDNSVTCVGPHVKTVTPHDDPEEDLYTYGYFPTKSRWVLTTPPIYAVTGTSKNPVGETEKLIQYRRACTTPALGMVRVLRPRIWGELTPGSGTTSGMIQLRIDDVPIGRVAGSDSMFAVSP